MRKTVHDDARGRSSVEELMMPANDARVMAEKLAMVRRAGGQQRGMKSRAAIWAEKN